MNKKLFALTLVLMLMVSVFTGCSQQSASVDQGSKLVGGETARGDLIDGTYLVKNPVSQQGNFQMVKLLVKDGEISDFDFNEYLSDSGQAKSEDNYPYADGIAVIKDLNQQFNEKKDLDAIDYDALSGATSTKNQFKEIVGEVLDKAVKGQTYEAVYKDGLYEAKANEDSHGWLPQVSVRVHHGQIVGVDYAELAIEDTDDAKAGDRKSSDNYSYEPPMEIAEELHKMIIDNNGTENLDLDALTGATSTRDTVIELVDQALSSAK